jgi:hypothetical protein
MAQSKPYPVILTGDLSDPPGRWVWLFKWLLAFPHYFILMFLFVAVFITWLVSLFAILFTGRYPRSLFDFHVGVLRWNWRVNFYAYSALGTDKYPPFSMDPGGYPADLEIAYPDKLSQGLVLIKWWLLIIPHAIIVSIFQGGDNFPGLVPILAIVSAIVMLFTGKYPVDLFKLIMGLNRWTYRVYGYALLFTDDYPPFSLD